MGSSQESSRPATPTQEALTEFILALGQAFLRTGYYLPDHPQSKQAKVGLHNRFQSLFAGRHELTFMLKEMGEVKNILVDGPLPETQNLSALMTRGMAEIYIPRLAKFLERKDLISLTLKESMGEEEFSHFVDVMSEPSLVTLDADGKTRFMNQLVERGVTQISFVFNDDLVTGERKLPWRAHVSISRLKKDFKCIPLFQDLDEEGLRAVRKQAISDVLRPISQPELMAVVLLNSDLAGTEEVPEEEIEDELVAFISDERLVAIGRAALSAHLATKEGRDLNGRKRVLVKLFRRLRSREDAEAKKLIRALLESHVIDFESLPEDLQAQITLEQETDRFLVERSEILGLLEESESAELYRSRGEDLLRVFPELVRRELLDEVLVVMVMFRGHAELEGFKGASAAQLLQEVGSGPIGASLKEKFQVGNKEHRVVLDPIFQALGDHGSLHLIDVLLETEDTWVRKNACETLLRSGEDGERRLTAALFGGELAVGDIAEVLMVFGEADCQSETVHQLLQRYVTHEEPKVREEAAWALCRVRGGQDEDLFLSLLEDPVLEVKKRAIRCLRHAKSHKALPALLEILRRAPDEPQLEPLVAHVYEALVEYPDSEIQPGVKTERFLVELLKASYPKGLRAMFRGNHRPLSGSSMIAICATLRAIGTGEALEVLKDLSKRFSGSARQRLQDVIDQIESRRALKHSEEVSVPARTASS